MHECIPATFMYSANIVPHALESDFIEDVVEVTGRIIYLIIVDDTRRVPQNRNGIIAKYFVNSDFKKILALLKLKKKKAKFKAVYAFFFIKETGWRSET